MLGFKNDKKMVERPENEPKFSLKNKVDRTIFFILLGLLIVVGILLAAAIVLALVF